MSFQTVSSPFSRTYWKEAVKAPSNLRVLTVSALLLALHIAISNVRIPLAENLYIYFRFLPMAVASCIGGPIMAVLYGIASDLLSFTLAPTGFGFFPGYTLSAVCSAVLYAFFLYRARVTVLRLFLSRALVNYLVNVLLGCLWSSIMVGKGYLYFLATSLPKNTILLPVEVALLVLLFRVLLPVLHRSSLAFFPPTKKISWF